MNCTRLKSSCSAAAVRTNSVLATPGTPSSSTCPRHGRAITSPLTTASCPTTALAISARRANSAARAASCCAVAGIGAAGVSRLGDLPFDVVERVCEVEQIIVGDRRRTEQGVLRGLVPTGVAPAYRRHHRGRIGIRTSPNRGESRCQGWRSAAPARRGPGAPRTVQPGAASTVSEARTTTGSLSRRPADPVASLPDRQGSTTRHSCRRPAPPRPGDPDRRSRRRLRTHPPAAAGRTR